MKKIIFSLITFFLLTISETKAQFVSRIVADSTLFLNGGSRTNNLRIQNSTIGYIGPLWNVGNGVTSFVNNDITVTPEIFGANGKDTLSDRPAIMKAIAFCDSLGGGTVYLAANNHYLLDTGVYLKSRVNMRIDGTLENRRGTINEEVEKVADFAVIFIGNYESRTYDTTVTQYYKADSIILNRVYLTNIADTAKFQKDSLVFLRGYGEWYHVFYKPYYITFAKVDSIVGNIVYCDNDMIDNHTNGALIGKVGDLKSDAFKKIDRNKVPFHGISDVHIYGNGKLISHGAAPMVQTTCYNFKLEGLTLEGTETISVNMGVRWTVQDIKFKANKQVLELSIGTNKSIFKNIYGELTGSEYKQSTQPLIRIGENAYHNLISNVSIIANGGSADSLSAISINDGRYNTIELVDIVSDSLANGVEIKSIHDSSWIEGNVIQNCRFILGNNPRFFINMTMEGSTNPLTIMKENVFRGLEFYGNTANSSLRFDGIDNVVTDCRLGQSNHLLTNDTTFVRGVFTNSQIGNPGKNIKNLLTMGNYNDSILFPVVRHDKNSNAVGLGAILNFNSTNNATAIGDSTLSFIYNAFSNTAVGFRALNKDSSGKANTAVGVDALRRNLSGDFNTAVGVFALEKNISGHQNVAVGRYALSESTGSNNIGIGFGAGKNLLLGDYNIAIGKEVFTPLGDTSNYTLNIGNTIIGTGINTSTGFNLTDTAMIGINRIPRGNLDVKGSFIASDLYYPTVDGTAGQFMTTDGAGNLYFSGGSGTVTSVGLSMPSGLTVTGSPVTGAGTIGVTTTLNGYVKGNGSGFTASATIPATDLSGTIDDARLSTNVGYTISHAIGAGVSTPASTTEYIINGPTGASGTESIRQVPVPIGGTIRQFYIYTSTAQPASGTYILTIRKNGTSNTTAITLAANAPAGVYNTNITSTVSAGDLLSVQLTNNATGASATLRGFSIFITPN